MSEKLRRRLGLEIRFLSDTPGTLMDALGIRDLGGLPPKLISRTPDRPHDDIFLPTTYLLDADGVIRWIARPDTYRVRATVDEVLAAVDRTVGGS